MIKNVLFDLDGTLLPMDQDQFVNYYFGMLCKKLAPYGYEAEKLVASIWKGTKAMVLNDGSKSNEEVFWKAFVDIFDEHVLEHKPVFEEFYAVEFQKAQAACGYNEKAGELVKKLKAKGCKLYLATNPIFPAIATQSRIKWAGLDINDFEIVTTYENSSSCKPNPLYYQEIMDKCGLKPEECIMVGNDVTEDMVAKKLGLDVFLLTDCIINKENLDISQYPNGDFDALASYLGV